jgi:transcriptional regulator with XRE-family HTH domain
MEHLTPADRLRAAIESWGTIRTFHKELEKHDDGELRRTRSMIHRYLRGEPQPPPAFLRAAAGLLRVRPDWLIRGEEPRTAAEARVTDAELIRGPGDSRIERALQTRGWSAGTRALFHEAWRRRVAAVPDTLIDDEALFDAGMDLLMLIELPADLWGFSRSMPDRRRDDAAVAMLHALMLMLPDPGLGDHLADRGTMFADGWTLKYHISPAEREALLTEG